MLIEHHDAIHEKLDVLTSDMEQVKEDIETLAENTGHERDAKGQLKKQREETL